jgi:hypothetical protein
MMKRIVSIGVAALLPTLCMSADLGQYVVSSGEGGSEGICLQAGGQWYSTTYDGWGGVWKDHGGHTYLEGNWASGAGNTALQFRQYAGTWLEWTDDGQTVDFWTHASAQFVGANCDAAAVGKGQRPAPGH